MTQPELMMMAETAQRRSDALNVLALARHKEKRIEARTRALRAQYIKANEITG